jgi:sec-independent protein translocase protein TatB
MFDIGFAELVLVAVVGLLVIGPERLPEAIRTGSAWLNRFRRGFNDIKREVQQELHNDAIMQDLRKTGEQLQKQAETMGRGIGEGTSSLLNPDSDGNNENKKDKEPATAPQQNNQDGA